MELELSYDIDNEQQFWDELHETVSRRCESNELIDDALRAFLNLATQFWSDYINTDHAVARCSYQLHCSSLFQEHQDYVRRQILHCLLEGDEPELLQLTAAFLLTDAQNNEVTFELMNNEGSFLKLVDLISKPQQDETAGVHRLLMELLYEMSRVQKIRSDDLMQIHDDFVAGLFQIIEELSDDVSDPYHYPVIRVLLVLNEQFLLSAHDPQITAASTVPLTNKVLKVLCTHGSKFKTFGENIILLLNREDETSLQLLTLKLLYLLFTTPPTYEYFYTNDLRVLVDILIRNLLDLPEDSGPLRHTYLRVLCPLLSHTQLRHPPQYKRDEIQKLLSVLGRGQGARFGPNDELEQYWAHFGEVDETTKRLVRRCQSVPWLMDPEDHDIPQTESPIDDRASAPDSPVSPSKSRPPIPAPRKLTKRNSSKGSALSISGYLTPQIEQARQSSISMISMAEIATHREKPGVITPSRNPSRKHTMRTSLLMGKKEKPPPPMARRSGASRSQVMLAQQRVEDSTASREIRHDATAEGSEKGLVPRLSQQETRESVKEVEKTDSVAHVVPPSKALPSQRKPPTLPKARRWRFSSKDGDDSTLRGVNREPGKFSSNLPSIMTFSKQLSESTPFTPTSPPSVLGRDGASVTTALGEAQAEAISAVGKSLDDVHLDTPHISPTLERTHTISPSIPELAAANAPSSFSASSAAQLPRKVVLAPPSLAPARGVPGPRFELERSPFLDPEDVVDPDELWKLERGTHEDGT